MNLAACICSNANKGLAYIGEAFATYATKSFYASFFAVFFRLTKKISNNNWHYWWGVGGLVIPREDLRLLDCLYGVFINIYNILTPYIRMKSKMFLNRFKMKRYYNDDYELFLATLTKYGLLNETLLSYFLLRNKVLLMGMVQSLFKLKIGAQVFILV